MANTNTATAVNPVLVASLSRVYAVAIRREENATTDGQAWKLAAKSEKALRRLQCAKAGLPLPEPRRFGPSKARQAFVALGTIGHVFARIVRASFRAVVHHIAMLALNHHRKEDTMQRKGPKSASSHRNQVAVTVLYRPYNHRRDASPIREVSFFAPADSAVEELIEEAHRMGATSGINCWSGVTEVQTPAGTWTCTDGTKLLTTQNTRLCDRATFVAAKASRKSS